MVNSKNKQVLKFFSVIDWNRFMHLCFKSYIHALKSMAIQLNPLIPRLKRMKTLNCTNYAD